MLFYKEDFQEFATIEYPYDKNHSALGEYHHYMPKGYSGNFYDPIALHQWRSQGGSWLVVSDGHKNYLEQNRGDYASGHFKGVSPILVLKKQIFAPYDMSFNIRLHDTKKLSGMCINYIHNRFYDSISLGNGKIIAYHKNQNDITVYQEKEVSIDSLKTYKIDIKLDYNHTKVYLDDKEVLSYESQFKTSKVAFIGAGASRFSNLEINMTDFNYELHIKLAREEELRLKNIQNEYAPMECIKKIDLKNFGSGRQFRMGRDSNGNPIFLLAQHQKRIMRDAFARLSCLTAFDLDGNILWQHGTPCNLEENTLISCDLPIQIADINNDGKQEVIYSTDFMVYIVSLDSGEVLSSFETPKVLNDPLVGDYPFDRLNPDGLRVADFKGLGYSNSIVLKDRYKNVWVYDANDFTLMWRYNHKNTGHFPYVYDFNKDGKDEIFIGYDMVDSNGNIKWSLPISSDHTDEIIYLEENKRLYLASGNEGFNIVSLDGEILKSNVVGHAQRISISNYEKGSDKLYVAVTSFWGADMIVYLYDLDGNLISEHEMMGNGNLVSPVAYDGTNSLILTNASHELGGLLDHNLDVAVMFPNDGHPTLCSEVLDIDNDGVDEIICWDLNEMWIYKSTKYKTGNKYDKYPESGFSNYRGEFLIKKK